LTTCRVKHWPTLDDDPGVTVSGEQRPAPLDREDLAQAFDGHAQEVFRYLARRCDDRALAEDLMSVVFLEAWRSRDRAVLVDGTLRPWLLGIAVNVLRNSRRSLRRHRGALDRYRATADRLVEPDHADDAVARADAASTRRQLDAAFASLSAKDRQVADMCLVKGLTPVQAAVALGLPVGTVKSRLAHARGRLRGVLRPGEHSTPTDPHGLGGHEQDERLLGAPTESAAP
jgi:RNA polymerase sigma factor (sigma-70 family)